MSTQFNNIEVRDYHVLLSLGRTLRLEKGNMESWNGFADRIRKKLTRFKKADEMVAKAMKQVADAKAKGTLQEVFRDTDDLRPKKPKFKDKRSKPREEDEVNEP
jgi:hypothetical protein